MPRISGLQCVATQLRQAYLISNSVANVGLESAVDAYLKRHPTHTMSQAVRHAAKYMVSDAIPGTPAWYRRHLADLLCMVRRWGLPSFFLTLTADEASDMRFEEVDAIVDKLNTDYPDIGMDWQVIATLPYTPWSYLAFACLVRLLHVARHFSTPSCPCHVCCKDSDLFLLARVS